MPKWFLVLFLFCTNLFLAEKDMIASENEKNKVPNSEDVLESIEKGTIQVKKEVKVPEIVKGFHIGADFGVIDYLGVLKNKAGIQPYGKTFYWGPITRLTIGVDAIKKTRFNLSIQGTFWQNINRGTPSYTSDGYVIQRSSNSIAFVVGAKPAISLGYTKRWVVHLNTTAGISLFSGSGSISGDGEYIPLDEKEVFPVIALGAGIEYYSRLSHFSINLLEANAVYALGQDIGLSIHPIGLKYTF